MKNIRNRKTRLAVLLLAAAVVCGLIGCGEEAGSGSSRSSMSMRVEDGGGLQIERLSRESITPMGEDGTWTVFVYLCGTDLESEEGMGAMDMEEMQSASTGENVQFVVQTGGTNTWSNEVDANVCQRYVIANGQMSLADEVDLANMGESATLADFLSWGVLNYGAEKMGLVLWNHGGGSITGVCFDELNENDSLSLREIDAALLSVYDTMTDNFEFIGFDACLMGTLECANVLASYADYMYASEEMEPGYGWDYAAIGNYLSEHPEADGAALGEEVTESFYASCERTGEEAMATFSVTDLSKTDALLAAFNTYANNLYTATENEETLAEVVRGVQTADNFGGNNKSEGYTNMVDLAGIVNAGAAVCSGADAVLSAIEDAVIYSKNGSDHQNACGLATYYPLEIQGSEELSVFGEIAVSPYYLSFVDRAAQTAAGESEQEDYDSEEAFDFWGNYTYYEDEDGYYEDSEDYYEEYADGDYFSYYDDYAPTGESALISFEREPGFDTDGIFGFTLSEEALNQTASVQASVFTVSADGADLIELGISVDIVADWETGTFSDNFDGQWFSLPDGQNLAVYVVSENDGYDVYTSPVEVNGRETNLRITHHYESGEITIDGTWGGIDEDGMAGREITRLAEGDEIIPLYYAVAADSEEEFVYYGEAYTFDGDPEIIFDYLPDGAFYYGFYIDDIYGDYYATDYVQFELDGSEVYYYEDTLSSWADEGYNDYDDAAYDDGYKQP